MSEPTQFELARVFHQHGRKYDEQWTVVGTLDDAVAEAQRMARRSQPVEIRDLDDNLVRVVRRRAGAPAPGRALTPITDPSQIPEFASEDEASAFWATHEITDELWAKLEPPAGDEPLPPTNR